MELLLTRVYDQVSLPLSLWLSHCVSWYPVVTNFMCIKRMIFLYNERGHYSWTCFASALDTQPGVGCVFDKPLSFPGGSDGKETSCSVEDLALIPGSGRSPENEMEPTSVFLPGKFMDRGAWQAIVHGVTKSQTWLNTHTHIVKTHCAQTMYKKS